RTAVPPPVPEPGGTTTGSIRRYLKFSPDRAGISGRISWLRVRSGRAVPMNWNWSWRPGWTLLCATIIMFLIRMWRCDAFSGTAGGRGVLDVLSVRHRTWWSGDVTRNGQAGG